MYIYIFTIHGYTSDILDLLPRNVSEIYLIQLNMVFPRKSISVSINTGLGGGFIFLFSPLFGEDSHFDYYFSNGLKPPTSGISHFYKPASKSCNVKNDTLL